MFLSDIPLIPHGRLIGWANREKKNWSNCVPVTSRNWARRKTKTPVCREIFIAGCFWNLNFRQRNELCKHCAGFQKPLEFHINDLTAKARLKMTIVSYQDTFKMNCIDVRTLLCKFRVKWNPTCLHDKREKQTDEERAEYKKQWALNKRLNITI